MSARSVVVTGGAGFIGSHLCEALVKRGDRVTVIDDLSTGVLEHVPDGARLVVSDLASVDLQPIFQDARPDVVVHLAAQANLRRSVADPIADARTNVLATLRVLEACKAGGASRLVFSSSGGAIYGEQDVLPTPEDATPRPASPYGAAKLAIEHYLGAYRTTAGLESIALRFGNVYGPRQLTQGEAGVVAIFAERMIRGENVTIFGDGSQSRDYVYVSDVVDATVRAIDRVAEGRKCRPINVGTGVETSVSGIVAALEKALGTPAKIRNDPAIAGELSRNCLDPRRAREDLGWAPRVTLDEGLPATVRWFQERA